jgi:hypothetical protein
VLSAASFVTAPAAAEFVETADVDDGVVEEVVDDVVVDVDAAVVGITATSVGGGATVDVVDGDVLCSWNRA